MKSLVVFALLLCINSAYGLKCFYCTSSHSWEDCEKEQRLQECPSDYKICVNMTLIMPASTGYGMKQFLRGCNPEYMCDYAKQSFESCKTLTKDDLKGENITCDVSCCSNDLCNESAVPVVSVIILPVACAFWALVRY